MKNEIVHVWIFNMINKEKSITEFKIKFYKEYNYFKKIFF